MYSHQTLHHWPTFLHQFGAIKVKVKVKKTVHNTHPSRTPQHEPRGSVYSPHVVPALQHLSRRGQRSRAIAEPGYVTASPTFRGATAPTPGTREWRTVHGRARVPTYVMRMRMPTPTCNQARLYTQSGQEVFGFVFLIWLNTVSTEHVSAANSMETWVTSPSPPTHTNDGNYIYLLSSILIHCYLLLDLKRKVNT